MQEDNGRTEWQSCFSPIMQRMKKLEAEIHAHVHAHSSLPCVCFSLLLPPPFFSRGQEVYPCSPAVRSQTGTSSKDRSIKVNRQDRK